MTKVEQAEMLELGLTEAQIDERKVWAARLLEGNEERNRLRMGPAVDMGDAANYKPTRKRRSDAGKPKAKKAEAAPGVLTQEQVERIKELMDARRDADEQEAFAHDNAMRAATQLDAYLDSLKGTA